jgi:hypothetical protein
LDVLGMPPMEYHRWLSGQTSHDLRQRHLERQLEVRAASATDAPDPYRPGLDKMRAATATPLSRFEDEYKRDRLAALRATSDALAAEAPTPRLTTAELWPFIRMSPNSSSARKSFLLKQTLSSNFPVN